MAPEHHTGRRRKSPGGFTLIELLVSMTILLLLMVVIFSVSNGATSIWSQSSAKIQTFQEARVVFESLTRKLSQATLNTYWDYEYDPTGNPTRYTRQSELQFVTGNTETLLGQVSPRRPSHGVFFQAPLGFSGASYTQLNQLLEVSGFFIEFGSDASDRPGFLNGASSPVPERWRYRLKELWQPAENLNIYSLTSGKPKWPAPGGVGNEWYLPALVAVPPSTKTLAENIVALVLLPRLPEREDFAGAALAPQYAYDSRRSYAYQGKDENGNPTVTGDIKNQLPPLIQVVMVAIDEKSAVRLAARNGTVPPNFGVDALFKQPTQLKQDLITLEGNLAEAKVSYRIFSTAVSIEGAKWSNN